jgi:ABC-type uncharacterized transport system involved in gliding motility auxiliary subunit
MKIIKMSKLFKKYIWCLGVIFVVGGLVANLLAQKDSIIPIILLIIGIIILIGWVISLNNGSNFWQKRSTQVGTNALISTLSVIIIIGMLNFMAFRYSFNVDLTETQIFTLAPQTVEVVKSLSQPLKVWIFEDKATKLDPTLLKEYAKYNNNFQFESVDPNEKLAIAQKFKIRNIGDVFIEYGDKKQQITSLMEGMPLTEIQLTNGIAKIIQDKSKVVYFVQGHGEPSLSASQGGMTQAVSSLEGLGYTVNPLVLASENKVPEDGNVLIIAGAKRKFLKEEVKLIQEYLDGGGSLFLMVEPDTKIELDDILKDWGVELNPQYIIVDPSTEQIVTSVVSFYGDHPITENFDNGISLYNFAMPIGTISKEGVEAIALVTTNEETWGENIDNLTENTEISFDPNTDLAAPLDIGIALTRIPTKSPTIEENNPNEKIETPQENPDNETNENPLETEENDNENPLETEENDNEKPLETEENDNKNSTNPPQELPEELKENPESNTNDLPKTQENEEENTVLEEETPTQEEVNPSNKTIESRMVVFGDSTFATDGWFDSQLNGDVFLNSVKWLVNDQENPLSIRPKEYQNRRLNITPIQSTMITLLALVLFPLLSIILSIFTWWKRQ